MKGVKYIVLGWILILPVLLSSCNKSHYQQVVDRELASGVRHDKLFLGFSFGMTKKNFYLHAWELNKKHLVSNGGSNASVRYELDSLKAPAKMTFYPQFYKDKIYLMPVEISYNSWAPWNRQYSADSLVQDVIHLFSKWYGSGFFAVHGPKGKVAYVKIDGNRQITILKHNDMLVKILFTDLSVENEIKKHKQPLSYFWNRLISLF